MSLLSRLFGKGDAPAEPVKGEDYKGFQIFPEPMADGKSFRIAARIEAEINGETKVHRLIRADTLGDRDEAAEASTAKAKLMIDQLGKAIFD